MRIDFGGPSRLPDRLLVPPGEAQAERALVLAFLSDPEVVCKILRHLGLPVAAPTLVPARSSGEARGFELEEEVGGGGEDDHDDDDGTRNRLGRAPPN